MVHHAWLMYNLVDVQSGTYHPIMLISTRICIEFWNVELVRHEYCYYHCYALEYAVLLPISEENVLVSSHVLQADLQVGEKEMWSSVQLAKEQPSCMEVCKGIVKNDVLCTRVLQAHLKVGGKEMWPSVQLAKTGHHALTYAKGRPSCIEACKGIVKNDVLQAHVLQTHLKVGGKEMWPSVQPAKERPSCTMRISSSASNSLSSLDSLIRLRACIE